MKRESGTIDRILSNIEQRTPSQQKKMTVGVDMLWLSRQLAEIDRHVPLVCNIKEAGWVGVGRGAEWTVEEPELKVVRRHMAQMKAAAAYAEAADPFA